MSGTSGETTSQGWPIRRSRGSAAWFHGLTPPTDLDRPEVWIHRIDQPALVLGSTQSIDLLRTDRLPPHLEVTRRRSGGGLVLVDPGTDCWIDLLIPRHHHLWNDDVGRSFHWVGDRWQAAIEEVYDVTASVSHDSRHRHRRPLICFADIGHGEVLVEGRKVVGLSQRRSRHTARVQCLTLARWRREWTDWLAEGLDGDAVGAAGFDGPLSPGDDAEPDAGLPPGIEPVDPDRLSDAFLAALDDD